MGLKTSWDLPRRTAAQAGPHHSLPYPRLRPGAPRSPAAAQPPGTLQVRSGCAPGTLRVRPQPGSATPARPGPRDPPRRAPTSTRAPGKKGRRAGPSPFIPQLTPNGSEPQGTLSSTSLAAFHVSIRADRSFIGRRACRLQQRKAPAAQAAPRQRPLAAGGAPCEL